MTATLQEAIAAVRNGDTERAQLLQLAELVAATTGLGYRITLAQRYLSTDIIIAYVLVLGVLGLVSDQLMRALGRKVFAYERIRR